MKRILFVDDDSRILDGFRRLLHTEQSRWQMHFVVGGEAALQACEDSTFDVVLSDLRMPGMDGATLLGHIRDRFPNTARVVLSGYSEVALAARTVPVAHRFLTKPCSASELRSVIEQVCSLQDILSAPEIRKIVGSVGELPSLSTTYTCLMQAVNDPDTSITRVAEIIEGDVAMSAKVLQLANSAFFGLAQEVTSLPVAATYLGMATIKNLALVSEAFRLFVPSPKIPQSVCEAMQWHSQHTASIASMLPMDSGIRDITVLAAFLHDIGSLFLASTMPDTFCAVLARAKERKCKLFEAEEELLGTSHAEIGAYLLGLWGIPHLAVEAIAHHHHPTRIPHTGFDCTTAVYLSDLLSHRWDAHAPDSTEPEPAIEESDHACLELLGVLHVYTEFRELDLQNLT